MPALRLFGRKWLAASDDLVFPCLFEICFRLVWLVLIAIVCANYWKKQLIDCESGVLGVHVYLIATLALIVVNLVLLVALVNRSAQGCIVETHARRLVAPLLVCKISLILPEILLNVFGTVWAFSDLVTCTIGEKFSKTVIEVIVLFNWVLFALIVFGLAIVFDPLGSTKYRKGRDNNDNGPTESALHRKVSSMWLRRFRWVCCCLRKDEFGHEAFTQVASLLSALFRGTDLVPSDIMAGCVLLRVRQKRETREMRRIRMLNDDGPRYTTDLNRVFSMSPAWMTIKNARHFMRFALAAYGWPMVCYLHCCTGPFRLIKRATCCACFRSRSKNVIEDNCCLCHLAGVKKMAKLNDEDVLHASFKNHVFELPFCVLADHTTKSIIVCVRGSLSLRDIFTDLTANSERFEAPGMPNDSSAHRGMMAGAEQLTKRLREINILERAFNTYPEYTLVLTGHSLGAGVSILAGAKLRPKYPDLRVYAFATPAGLLSREAARYTESFTFTVGLGDDFVMRLGVESIENLRTMIIETLRACKLPKYRIMLNGFGYAIFGVPSRDLETTWHATEIETPVGVSKLTTTNVTTTMTTATATATIITTPTTSALTTVTATTTTDQNYVGAIMNAIPATAIARNGQSPLLSTRSISYPQNVTVDDDLNGISTVTSESALFSREISKRRFAKTRLFTGGRILHIVRRKKTELEKKTQTGGPTYEMRWAVAEDFTELKVMPRMLLDHFPDSIFKAMSTIIDEQKVDDNISTTEIVHEII